MIPEGTIAQERGTKPTKPVACRDIPFPYSDIPK